MILTHQGNFQIRVRLKSDAEASIKFQTIYFDIRDKENNLIFN